jgi:hypothetical protein
MASQSAPTAVLELIPSIQALCDFRFVFPLGEALSASLIFLHLVLTEVLFFLAGIRE